MKMPKVQSTIADLKSMGKCRICDEKFKKDSNIISLSCDNLHIFHYECISDHVNKQGRCPVCRTEASREDIERAHQQRLANGNGQHASGTNGDRTGQYFATKKENDMV